MNQIEYLQQQAARAERLARDVLDRLTVERLQAFADECRKQIKALDAKRIKAACKRRGSDTATRCCSF